MLTSFLNVASTLQLFWCNHWPVTRNIGNWKGLLRPSKQKEKGGGGGGNHTYWRSVTELRRTQTNVTESKPSAIRLYDPSPMSEHGTHAVIECKMPILFLIYAIYIHRHYHHSHIYNNSWHALSNGLRGSVSWQSVALDSRVREFDSHQRPWSFIFRNWSRLSLRKFTHSQKYPYRLRSKCVDFTDEGKLSGEPKEKPSKHRRDQLQYNSTQMGSKFKNQHRVIPRRSPVTHSCTTPSDR